MLGFLFELAASLAICGVLAYYLFLSAPPEEPCADSPSAAGEEHSSSPPAQALHAWWATFLPWDASSPLFPLYRYIMLHIVGVDPEEFFLSQDSIPRAPRGEHGVGNGATASVTGANGGRGLSADRAAAAARRNRLNGHAARAASPPSPLRREGAQWIHVLCRWLGMLLLGGGTTSTAVWGSRVLCGAERGVARVNAAYERKMQERQRAMSSARGGRGTLSSSSSAGRNSVVARPLLRLLLLELGPGLMPMGSRSSAAMSAGPAGSGNSAAVIELPASVAIGGATAGVGSPGGVGGLAVGLGGPASSSREPSLLADEGGAESGVAGAAPPHTAASAGGVALPRVAGDITSVEVLSYTAPPCPVADGSPPNAPLSPDQEAVRMATAAAGAPRPSLSPLRCFCVPLLYEDNRFVLRLGCSLPLMALLPASLPIPADVLTLDCQVAVQRVSFHGSLHAAFRGSIVELSFAAAPHFTATVDVAAPPSKAGRLARQDATPSSAFVAISTMRNAAATAPAPVAASSPHGASSSASAAGATMPDGSSPAAPSHASGPFLERNAKVQELVMLALRRAVDSITYPNVLEGRIALSADDTAGPGATAVGPSSSTAVSSRMLQWRRTKAVLPLYT